ncbi:MAG: flagellin FliC [Betaproteobacteria bacterium]|nr:flagellin FliC [Betaproteobacteria bacterium]
MSVINTNVSSLFAQASIKVNARQMQQAMSSLSTGKRINSAVDDAAGSGIASTMTADIRGLAQAVRNSNDAISLLQTADGALIETTNMLQRMRELAVQATSGTYSTKQLSYNDKEYQALLLQIGSMVTTEALGTTAVGLVDAALDIVNTQRAVLGAGVNQLTYAGDNMQNIATNTAASRSRIEDTDYAVATTTLAKTQIIQQAATAMLAQANQQPQSVLARQSCIKAKHFCLHFLIIENPCNVISYRGFFIASITRVICAISQTRVIILHNGFNELKM